MADTSFTRLGACVRASEIHWQLGKVISMIICAESSPSTDFDLKETMTRRTVCEVCCRGCISVSKVSWQNRFEPSCTADCFSKLRTSSCMDKDVEVLWINGKWLWKTGGLSWICGLIWWKQRLGSPFSLKRNINPHYAPSGLVRQQKRPSRLTIWTTWLTQGATVPWFVLVQTRNPQSLKSSGHHQTKYQRSNVNNPVYPSEQAVYRGNVLPVVHTV